MDSNPAGVASLRPLPPHCADASTAPFAEGQRFFALGAPLRGPYELTVGALIRGTAGESVADFRLASGSIGGPVFSTSGDLVGLSSTFAGVPSVSGVPGTDAPDERASKDARIVRLDEVCAAVEAAEQAMASSPRPQPARLPVEPQPPLSPDSLAAEARRRAGALNPYQTSTSDFDVAFFTPTQVYAALNDVNGSANAGRRDVRGGDLQQVKQAALRDFGVWSDYFADNPPVLVVRVTPKLSEGFWKTLARGAAYTQGVALPPFAHFKASFSWLRAKCGDVEVAPVHPFTLERRLSERDAIREGLYVFGPHAFGPHCKTVTLELHSEKDGAKADTHTIEPQMIERIWQDFAPYRSLVAASGGDDRR